MVKEGDIKKLLKGMQGAYDESKDYAVGIPDGQYRLQLLEAKIIASKQSGKLMIRRKHTVLEGDFEGRTVSDNVVVGLPGEENVVGWSIARQWVELCGYEAPETPEDMLDVLVGLTEENPVVIAQVETNDNGFVNVRVNELEEEAAVVDKPKAGVKPKAGPKKVAAKEEPKDEAAAEGEWSEGDEVEFDNEDDVVTGTIVDFEDENAHVKDGDDEVWVVDVSDLRAKKSRGKTKEGAEKKKPGKKMVDDDTALLLAFAQANGVADEDKLDEDSDKKSIVKALKGYKWDANDLTDGEVELLGKHDIEYKERKAAAKKVLKKK